MGSLLARAQQKIFGSSAGTSQFGQIGSQTDGAPVTTKDLATIQSLSHFLLGLYSITNNATQPPFVEDINALYLLITQQLAYIFQAGISEYDAGTNYFNLVSYVQVNGVIYQSINGTDLAPNVGNDPTSSPTFWRKLIDTDVNLAANSDLVIASQKATKTYVDAEKARALAAEALLAPNASPTFTGTVVVPAAAGATSPYQKQEVDTALALKAPLASPTFTGTPTAPTQSPLNNSTRLATTAYADLAVGVESSARASADSTLQGNINAEATTRANADTTLQNNINTEATARIANTFTSQVRYSGAYSTNQTDTISAMSIGETRTITVSRSNSGSNGSYTLTLPSGGSFQVSYLGITWLTSGSVNSVDATGTSGSSGGTSVVVSVPGSGCNIQMYVTVKRTS